MVVDRPERRSLLQQKLNMENPPMNQADFELGGTMNGQTGEQAKTADLIPHGTKAVVALTSAKKNLKQRDGAPNGVMNVTTTLTFTVQEGDYRGRVVRRTIGNDHPSDTYMSMSRAFLAKFQIAHGVGNQVLTSLAPLANKPVLATIVQTGGKKAGDQAQNDISEFSPAINLVGSMPPAGPAPMQAPTMQQAPAHTMAPGQMTAPPAMPASTLPGGAPPWRT